ncbi:hypothetical protein [Nocardia macrotermitis]|uniref:Uncharacterized protein n=1 Tax=Nocardia macrotermitis TaxID=2585198 RepID=A0A7K0D5W1_9NOCA|nr:hypothetical protein [Nocardia macrotermitis]MQY21146.1 hypothetical protein [Nocardia macrotermitis]
MSARTDLAAELDGHVAALDMLSEQEAADLLSLFRNARQVETAALNSAIDDMVGVLPKPFRGVTKRIMFGDMTAQ